MSYKEIKGEVRNTLGVYINNLQRWIAFYCWIQTQNPASLRFVDEVHFEPKSLRRAHGYAPKGSRIIHISKEFITERYSMILMTVPDGHPQPYQARIYKETVDAPKFVLFILGCILSGALTTGNILILDNAATHFSLETYQTLTAMLQGAGVSLVFLPTYSPELNPCELIFGLVKNYIRNHRGQEDSLLAEILKASVLLHPSMLLHSTTIVFSKLNPDNKN